MFKFIFNNNNLFRSFSKYTVETCENEYRINNTIKYK